MKFLNDNEAALNQRIETWKMAVGITNNPLLQLKRPALLVLDMQNDFLLDAGQLPVWGGPAVIPRIKQLIAAFRALRLPIFFTRHYCIEPYRHKDDLGSMKNVDKPDEFLRKGSMGAEFHVDIAPAQDDFVVTKYRYSGFYDTPLDTLLRVNQITDVVITGVATNICCETTAHDAFFRGYNVIFMLDATGGTDEVAHIATLRNIKLSYGAVVTTEIILPCLDSQGYQATD